MARFRTGLVTIALLMLGATRTAHALEGATLDTQDSFAVAIVTQGAPGQTRPQCSGVLISENVVLTARHCFDQPAIPVATLTSPTSMNCELTPSQFTADAETLADVASRVWITTSHAAHVATTGWHRARRIHVPSSSRNVCGADIALVVLDDRVPTYEAIAASPSHVGSSSGKTAIAIGHGATTALGGDAGERRLLASMTTTTSPSPSSGYFDPKSELVAGDGACLGDSGSGLFQVVNAQPPSVVGVLARTRIDGDDGHCRDGVYERIDPWMPFLRDVVVAAAEESGSSVPEWTSSTHAMNVPRDDDEKASSIGTPATDATPREDRDDRPIFSGEYTGCAVSRSCSSSSIITTMIVFALSILLVGARRRRSY